MPIYVAAILDQESQEIIVPAVDVHFLMEDGQIIGGAFRIAALSAAGLTVREKYRLALEDGRTTSFTINWVQDHPDGARTFYLSLEGEPLADL